MRRSKAYILTEIMMSMMLQAMFIIVLSGAFYMMLSFYTKTQQLQTARERGHRVISYVDQRIRHAGLGLWDSQNSDFLRTLLDVGGVLASDQWKMNLPVSVISKDIVKNDDYYKSEDISGYNIVGISSGGKIFRGNILTLLYAYKDFDDSKSLIFKESNSVPGGSTTSGQSFDLFADLSGTGFTNTNSDNQSNRLSITESTGVPLVNKNVRNATITLRTKSNDISYVYAGSELLHAGCERMFVTYNNNLEERSFAFAFPEENGWGQVNHHVAGILEIYIELHAPENGTKTLDLYVLSTGGKDSSSTNKSRPATWPGHWDDNEYGKYVLYVSRASWKLNNIPKDFVFSYSNSSNS